MTIFDFISRFILFLVPGLILHTAFSYLTGKKPLKDTTSLLFVFLDSIVSIFTANIILYFANYLCCRNWPLIQITKIISGECQNISLFELGISIACAVILVLVFVAVHEKNVLFRIANFLKITNKRDNSDVWTYIFDNDQWVIIRDYISGNTYYGLVETFSDTGEHRELLLKEVSVTSPKGRKYKMKKVYLSRNPSEFTLEIDYFEKRKNHGKDK